MRRSSEPVSLSSVGTMREHKPAAAESFRAALPDSAAAKGTVSVVRGVALLRLPSSMDPVEFAIRRDAFLRMLAQGRYRTAVVDATAVDTMDRADVEGLRKLLVAIALMGATPNLAGLQPGVAAILADAGPSFMRGIRVLRDLDEALEPG